MINGAELLQDQLDSKESDCILLSTGPLLVKGLITDGDETNLQSVFQACTQDLGGREEDQRQRIKYLFGKSSDGVTILNHSQKMTIENITGGASTPKHMWSNQDSKTNLVEGGKVIQVERVDEEFGDASTDRQDSPSPQKSQRDQFNMNNQCALQLINEPQMDGVPPSNQILSIQRVQKSDPCINLVPFKDLTGSCPQGSWENMELFGWGRNDCSQMGQINHSNQSQILIPRNFSKLNSLLPPITQIVCGPTHSFLLSQDFRLFAQGTNSYGQLGVKEKLLSQPVQVPVEIHRDWESDLSNIQVVQVCTSPTHSLILCRLHPNTAQQEHIILAAGSNEQGQLGVQERGRPLGEFQEVDVVNNYGVLSGSRVQKVFCQRGFSGVLLWREGVQEIWLWGAGESLEWGNKMQRLKKVILPVSIQTEGGISQIECSENTIWMVSAHGTLYRCKIGMTVEKVELSFQTRQISASQGRVCMLSHNGQIYSLDESSLTLVERDKSILIETKISQIWCGDEFVMALDCKGSLYGQGNNQSGELGTGDSFPRHRLTQIRVFNSNQDYLKCKWIFTGHSYCFGYFEPPPSRLSEIPKQLQEKDLNRNLRQKQQIAQGRGRARSNENGGSHQRTIESEQKRRLESAEKRQQKIDETERALERYRKTSIEYKMNAFSYQDQVTQEISQPPSNHFRTISHSKMSMIDPILDQSNKVSITYNQPEELRYSPQDIIVTKHPHQVIVRSMVDSTISSHLIDQENSFVDVEQRQILPTMNRKSDNQCSFSWLQHKFDENKAELTRYKEIAETEMEQYRVKKQNLSKFLAPPPDTLEKRLAEMEGLLSDKIGGRNKGPELTFSQLRFAKPSFQGQVYEDRDKRQSSQNRDMCRITNPPSVSTIERTLDESQLIQQRPTYFNPNFTDFGQTRVSSHGPPYQRQIEFVERSVSDTSSLLDQSRMAQKTIPQYQVSQQNATFSQSYQQHHQNQILPISLRNQASALNQPSIDQSGTTSMSLIQHKDSTNQSSSQVNSSANLTPYLESQIQVLVQSGQLVHKKTYKDVVAKLNRYKRKLKKYLGSNQVLSQHNDHLRQQNSRLLRSQTQISNSEEATRENLKQMEHQIMTIQQSYSEILNQKQRQIQEQQGQIQALQANIEERDRRHEDLDSKFSLIEKKLMGLIQALQVQKEENERLMRRQERSKDKSSHYKRLSKDWKQKLETVEREKNMMVDDAQRELREANMVIGQLRSQIQTQEEVIQRISQYNSHNTSRFDHNQNEVSRRSQQEQELPNAERSNLSNHISREVNRKDQGFKHLSFQHSQRNPSSPEEYVLTNPYRNLQINDGLSKNPIGKLIRLNGDPLLEDNSISTDQSIAVFNTQEQENYLLPRQNLSQSFDSKPRLEVQREIQTQGLVERPLQYDNPWIRIENHYPIPSSQQMLRPDMTRQSLDQMTQFAMVKPAISINETIMSHPQMIHGGYGTCNQSILDQSRNSINANLLNTSVPVYEVRSQSFNQPQIINNNKVENNRNKIQNDKKIQFWDLPVEDQAKLIQLVKESMVQVQSQEVKEKKKDWIINRAISGESEQKQSPGRERIEQMVKMREIEEKEDYKNRLLRKFDKKTSDLVTSQMKQRDGRSSNQVNKQRSVSVNPSRSRGRDGNVIHLHDQRQSRSVTNTPTPVNHQNQHETLHNFVDRLSNHSKYSSGLAPRGVERSKSVKSNEIEEREEMIQRQKDWFIRRNLGGDQKELTKKQMELRYSEAFRNLSQELKRKINDHTKNQNFDTSYSHFDMRSIGDQHSQQRKSSNNYKREGLTLSANTIRLGDSLGFTNGEMREDERTARLAEIPRKLEK